MMIWEMNGHSMHEQDKLDPCILSDSRVNPIFDTTAGFSEVCREGQKERKRQRYPRDRGGEQMTSVAFDSDKSTMQQNRN